MESIDDRTFTTEDVYNYTLEVLRSIQKDYALFSEIETIFPNKRLTLEEYTAAATHTLNEACKILLHDDVEAITPSIRGMIIGLSIDDSATLLLSIKQLGIKEPRLVNISEIIALSPLSKYDAQLISST